MFYRAQKLFFRVSIQKQHAGFYTFINNVLGSYTDTRERLVSCFGLLEADNDRSVDYSIFLDNGLLYINGDASAQEPVYVGFYDTKGKLADLRILTAEADGDTVEHINMTPDIAKIKVMWWKNDSIQPNCKNAVIELK